MRQYGLFPTSRRGHFRQKRSRRTQCDGHHQPDLSKWDYRHQVLTQPNLSPWKMFFAVKWLELRFHGRPGRLWSILRMKNPFLRHQLLWTSFHTGLLWLGEVIWELLGIRCARHATKAMAAKPEPKKNRKDLEQIKGSNGKPATRRPKVKRVNYPRFLRDGFSRKAVPAQCQRIDHCRGSIPL